jgi:hypothetical protein
MKSDYRFRDLDAQPVTPTHADACMEFAVNGTCRHTDPSNHSRVSDVVPSPENVSQVTSNANCEHLNKTVATVRGVPYHDCPDCGSVLDWIPQPSEVERLRAINAQLVAALYEVAHNTEDNWARGIANAALRGVKEQ